jgi:hypothetical protein
LGDVQAAKDPDVQAQPGQDIPHAMLHLPEHQVQPFSSMSGPTTEPLVPELPQHLDRGYGIPASGQTEKGRVQIFQVPAKRKETPKALFETNFEKGEAVLIKLCFG